DKLGRCLPRSGLIAEVHRRVVEKEDKIAPLGGPVRSARLGASREAADGLLLIVLVDRKIFGLEIADVIPLLVRGDGIHEHQVGLGLDDAGNRRNRLLAPWRRSLRSFLRKSRSAKRSRSQPAECGKQGQSHSLKFTSVHKPPSFSSFRGSASPGVSKGFPRFDSTPRPGPPRRLSRLPAPGTFPVARRNLFSL